MGKIKSLFFIVVSMLLVSAWIPVSNGSKKVVASARKEDIPYIKCQVCEKLAAQLYHQVQKKQAEIDPKKLVEQESEGQCNSECKTIERACQEVMGYSDTDVAEYLYTSKPQIDSLVNFLCKDLTKACSTKPPPVPKDRTPGEPFVPKSSKEAEMEKIMKSMEGMPGAPGMKMYSRDDLMNMNNFGGDDEEEDDDDEEAHFPSNLGKDLRQKESSKGDWKQKITTGITHARDSLKKHAYKVSNRVRQWWKVKKTAGSKNLKNSKSDL
ncbi:hypothetical protein RGQ29_011632 [Quercus rubra]|uniref:Saposin B-type domain-containing protein n=1 Tax=Quercus rubra TaxID=3512 RepID=A0AAN7FYU0_QUERU|nr:hypothetical protein RGQ29_011632 [Quercus rubra]